MWKSFNDKLMGLCCYIFDDSDNQGDTAAFTASPSR